MVKIAVLSFEVKVISNSSQNKVVGFEGDVLKVKCTAAPEKGKANSAVIALLAKHYDVPKSAIEIVSGKTSCRKLVKITKGGS